MLKFLRNFFIIFVVLFVLSWILPNFSLGYPTGANFNWLRFINALPIIVVATLVLAVLTTVVRPVLRALFLPINFLTLGLANFFLDIVLLVFASYLVPGFEIGSLSILGMNLGVIGGAGVAALIFSLLQTGLTLLM